MAFLVFQSHFRQRRTDILLPLFAGQERINAVNPRGKNINYRCPGVDG